MLHPYWYRVPNRLESHAAILGFLLFLLQSLRVSRDLSILSICPGLDLLPLSLD
jgi:hypothetical protein